MDEHTLNEYGWIIIIIVVVVALLAFAPTLANTLTSHEENLIAGHLSDSQDKIIYTQGDIDTSNGRLFAVGEGTALNVVAFVNTQHTALLIVPNADTEDLVMVDNLSHVLASSGVNIDSIRSVTINDGITNIGVNAFANFTSLSGVDIPASVKTIGSRALHNCSSLSNIAYGGAPEQWFDILFAPDWDSNAHSYELIINNQIVENVCAIVLDNSANDADDSTPLIFGNSILPLQAGDVYNSEVYGKLPVKAAYYGFETSVVVPWKNYSNEITSVVVEDVVAPVTTASWFKDMRNCIKMDLRLLNTPYVVDMSQMFSGCALLLELDLSNFRTSTVTTMEGMFNECNSLTRIALSNFDTSNVRSMKNMFRRCVLLNTLDVSRFNTANVTDMSGMFESCGSLTSLNLYNFNTAKVANMSCMFFGAANLNKLNLSRFNTSMVTDMSQMFSGASRLTSLDMSGFNTSNVKTMADMFNGCSTLTLLNVSHFNTAQVTDMKYMFAGCINLLGLDVSTFNTAIVTDMNHMFSSVGSAASTWSMENISHWNTALVTDMSGMFEMMAPNVEYELDLSAWNVGNVTSYSNFNAGVDAQITPPIWNVAADSAA